MIVVLSEYDGKNDDGEDLESEIKHEMVFRHIETITFDEEKK